MLALSTTIVFLGIGVIEKADMSQVEQMPARKFDKAAKGKDKAVSSNM